MSLRGRSWRDVYLLAQRPRFLPHRLAFQRSPHRDTIVADVDRWRSALKLELPDSLALDHLLTWYPEFRTLFYFRLGPAGRALASVASGMPTLFLATPRDKIGPGLFIQHGFATVISAASIGSDCWINQQVTIGYTDETSCPTIEDRVTIGAGAIVIGDIRVASGSVIGAGAVVVKDVPPNSVVVGSAARVTGTRPARGDGDGPLR